MPSADGPACNCDPDSARVDNGILLFGRGYSDAIVADHIFSLTPKNIAPRRAFDERFAGYCDAAFRELCDPVNRPTALSLGCGPGFELIELIKLGYDAYGMEVANLSELWFKYLEGEAWRCVLSTTGELPFPDNSFDLITCMNVFEHVGTVPPSELVTETTVAERDAFIRRAVKKLKPGGLFVMVCSNRAYPFDSGHAHHYVPSTHEMIVERGFTYADPFDDRNFLPTWSNVIDTCKSIASESQIALVMLTDRHLFGSEGPETKDPDFANRLNEVSLRWSQETGEPVESARNPHLQAFVRKAPSMRSTVDLSGEWAVTLKHGPEIEHTGRWTRQAFLPTLFARWALYKSNAPEADIMQIEGEQLSTGRIRLRCRNISYVFDLTIPPPDSDGRRTFEGKADPDVSLIGMQIATSRHTINLSGGQSDSWIEIAAKLLQKFRLRFRSIVHG